MIEIERIEIVTPIQGRTGTVMAQRVETTNGRTTYIEPVDLLVGFDGSALPREVQQALEAIDTQQKELIDSLTTERDSLRQRVSELEQSLSTKTSEAESLQSQVDQLQAELEDLRNPPQPTSVTPAQIRVWLILNVGPQVLDNIDAMLDQIADEATRKIARIKWEYGITVLRNDPLLIQFAKALGFTESQMDQAFLEASQIG